MVCSFNIFKSPELGFLAKVLPAPKDHRILWKRILKDLLTFIVEFDLSKKHNAKKSTNTNEKSDTIGYLFSYLVG